MVSIQVTYAPIHDIPMGLAADGTARAVAYPVGSITRNRFFPDRVESDFLEEKMIIATPTVKTNPNKPS